MSDKPLEEADRPANEPVANPQPAARADCAKPRLRERVRDVLGKLAPFPACD